MRKWAVALLAATLVLLSVAWPVAAQQNRTVFWNKWDVTIDNVDTTHNSFVVTESYDIQFTGTFHAGERAVALHNLSDIRSIAVSENGQPFRESCSSSPGTFCVTDNDNNERSIDYEFVKPITNGNATFQIQYTVVGALRSYPEGDQLWWQAVTSDHYGFSIGSSTITVKMPTGYGPREGVDSVVTYGEPSTVEVNGTTIVAKATGQITGDQFFEIRAQYPHDPNGAAPSWQASEDFKNTYGGVISLGLGVLSLAILIGGSLGFYTLWRVKGRDPEVGPVPQFLTDLPSDLPPAVIGTLIDEKADLRDILSTFIDLSRRGFMVIEETQTPGIMGFGGSSSFNFKRTDKPLEGLRTFEQRIMSTLFGSGNLERSMQSLQYRFYQVIPLLQNDLYDELVKEGLFPEKPTATRTRYSLLGGLLVGLALVGFCAATSLVESISSVVMCLPAALGVAGVAGIIVAQYMPVKTQKGAEETAKWNAFIEYLRNLEKYSDVKEKAVHFEDFLPYAVAFGLDRSLIMKFRAVPNVPVPYWYYPTYLGGPWGRGYMAGTPHYGPQSAGGDAPSFAGQMSHAPGAGGGLDAMSGGLSRGLESMSSGLTNMLNSASAVMSSRPQASSSGSSGQWRSGGSHWSGGGGFSGGGHSGGGHSGFR